MANGQLITSQGRLIALNRTFKETPDYKAPEQFKVGTGSTTPAITDTDLVTAVVIAGGLYVKDIAATYPSFDETNFQVTNRCILLTTDANGNNLTEFGLFNKDGTPKCFSRMVFPAIAKTTSVSVVFIEKDKVVIN